MVTGFVKWVVTGGSSGAACLEGAGAVDSPKPSSQHAVPASLGFVCEMAVRRPACKSCCEERGQSWQQKNVKPKCVSGMQSSGRKGREEHEAAWAVGEDYHPPGPWCPLPPGITGLWKKTHSLQPQLPLRLALRNGRKSEASCKSIW